jgi:uncharacterized protein (DUF1499 family)
MMQKTKPARPLSPLAAVGLALALGALIATAIAGPGVRIGLWDYRTGLQVVLRWGAIGGIVAFVISLAACFTATAGRRYRGLGVAAVAMAIGAATFAVPYVTYLKFRSAPRVWDITTDTANPPQFVAIVPLRANAPNIPQYRASMFAAIQKKAYPDIVPVQMAQPPADAFRIALAVARDFGWEIIASVPGEGRIEATDTSFWFGFKDDIVIRVVAEDGGSRLDIRSYSRLGRNDGGKNAARVRAYIARLKAESARR